MNFFQKPVLLVLLTVFSVGKTTGQDAAVPKPSDEIKIGNITCAASAYAAVARAES